jgi:hypothetical protein
MLRQLTRSRRNPGMDPCLESFGLWRDFHASKSGGMIGNPVYRVWIGIGPPLTAGNEVGLRDGNLVSIVKCLQVAVKL